MDSHTGMLETATGSGSNSSDSIVPISRSDASSITTFASDTNIIPTTTTTEEKLLTEIETLRDDKKLLEGRIRGYRTLSDLLVECRKENKQLKAEVESLRLLTSQHENFLRRTYSQEGCASPFSLMSMQVSQQQAAGTTRPPEPSMKTPSVQDANRSSPAAAPVPPPQMSYNNLSSVAPSSTLAVSGPPSSLQETGGPAEGGQAKLISLTSPAVTGAEVQPAWLPPSPISSSPRQESMGPVVAAGSLEVGNSLSGGKKQAGSFSAEAQAGFQDRKSPPGERSAEASLSSVASPPELLQLDSDKYDEATYEKVGFRLGMGGAGGLTGSLYGASSGSQGRQESRPTDFPSLSSELSNGAPLPSNSSRSSIHNPPFMAMMHHSQMGANSGLAGEVESLTERLNSETGDSSAALAYQMHQIAERISKVERKEKDQKRLVDALMRENQELKSQLKMADSSHQSESVQLREQNTRLMQQLKGPNRDEATLVRASSAHGDWVHVERSRNMGDSFSASDQPLVGRICSLEQEKAELQRVNTKWKLQWDKLEESHKHKLSEVRTKLALSQQELDDLKARQREQISGVEARMLEMKRRIEEEEGLKEEAQHQFHLAQRNCTEMRDQLNGIRTQLSDTARDKQALTAELSVLKARTTGQEGPTGRGSGSAQANQAAFEMEIAMLKEQLKVFAEDFEQERADRSLAQSTRDEAKKNAETVARQNLGLSAQIKSLQKQIKDRDDTISWTLRQNETMQRQISDCKKKLAMEWDEKQGLQRMLTLAQRQQQQQQHQPLRNPYLPSSDPQPMYNNSNTSTQQFPRQAPFQPPPPAPHHGGGGGGYGGYGGGVGGVGMSGLGGAAMSPEHLPGAWTCAACTYINHPGRTVCESCGLVNSPRSHPDHFGFPSQDIYGSSEHALLMSRGGDQQQQNGRTAVNNDLVVDSGAWGPTH